MQSRPSSTDCCFHYGVRQVSVVYSNWPQQSMVLRLSSHLPAKNLYVEKPWVKPSAGQAHALALSYNRLPNLCCQPPFTHPVIILSAALLSWEKPPPPIPPLSNCSSWPQVCFPTHGTTAVMLAPLPPFGGDGQPAARRTKGSGCRLTVLLQFALTGRIQLGAPYRQGWLKCQIIS